jgi:2-methylisocitrate lyase-like PEP mutase family enzyme
MNPLYDLKLAIERIKAAREEIDRSHTGVLLTARAECYLVGHPDPFRESIRRLRSYAEAGADVLYAPGVHEREEIRTLVSTFDPMPINLLVSRNIGMSVAEIEQLGVRRISVGSTLARAAWTGFMRAVEPLASDGRFTGFDHLVSFADLNEFFRRDLE